MGLLWDVVRRDRARALIQIVCPDFQAALMNENQRRFYCDYLFGR